MKKFVVLFLYMAKHTNSETYVIIFLRNVEQWVFPKTELS